MRLRQLESEQHDFTRVRRPRHSLGRQDLVNGGSLPAKSYSPLSAAVRRAVASSS
jgi:hypothetical protein